MSKMCYSEACEQPTRTLLKEMGYSRYKDFVRSVLAIPDNGAIVGVYGNRAGNMVAKNVADYKSPTEYYVSREDYANFQYSDNHGTMYSVFDGIDEITLRNFALAQYVGI